MVAHVLRLRLDLLFGAVRGRAAHVGRAVFALVVVALAVAAASWGLMTMRSSSSEALLAVLVLGGSAVGLGFFFAPLVGGAADPLDPRRFAVLGVAPGPLAGALALAGVVSVPTLAVTVVAVVAAIVWSGHGAPTPAIVIGVVITVLTMVLLARVSMAVSSLVLRERRSRELSGLFLLVLLIVVVPIGVFLASLQWHGEVPAPLGEAVGILALTPLGAAWAYPGLVATSDPAAVPSLLIALATILVLAGLWVLLVRLLLTTPERPASVRDRGGLGWFAVAPGTAAGGVAARSLIYWFHDRRYLVNAVVIPIMAVITVVPLVLVGVPLEYAVLIPAPLMALFFGWLPHNDLAYDSTAVWMHISSGVRGSADRIGRLVPILIIAVPTLAVAIPVTMWLHGRWALLPAMIGVCAVLFLSGLGLSSISSVVAPYAVPHPGESPFQQPQRVGSGGAISQSLVFLGALLAAVPVLWWSWTAITSDIDEAGRALWGGIGIGVAVLVIGVLIGAFAFSRRGTRIMEFAEAS